MLNSLAVTYFRMGIHTIIGAEAFHCPVRDGKEWYHLAMAAKLDWLRCLRPSVRRVRKHRELEEVCWMTYEVIVGRVGCASVLSYGSPYS